MNLGSRAGQCSLIVVLLFVGAISSASGAPTSEDVAKGKLLYEENFSSSKTSLFTGALGENFSCYFGDGRYHLELVPMNYLKEIAYGPEYNNSIIEVEATQESGPDDNNYGVMFRKVDWNNFYIFVISGDGYYQIAKLRSNKWEFVTPWRRSSAIHTGDATNLIRVVCNGDKFSFYVNDIKVDDYADGSFGSGMVGFVAGTMYCKDPVKIGFDNLKIWEIAK